MHAVLVPKGAGVEEVVLMELLLACLNSLALCNLYLWQEAKTPHNFPVMKNPMYHHPSPQKRITWCARTRMEVLSRRGRFFHLFPWHCVPTFWRRWFEVLRWVSSKGRKGLIITLKYLAITILFANYIRPYNFNSYIKNKLNYKVI